MNATFACLYCDAKSTNLLTVFNHIRVMHPEWWTVQDEIDLEEWKAQR